MQDENTELKKLSKKPHSCEILDEELGADSTPIFNTCTAGVTANFKKKT